MATANQQKIFYDNIKIEIESGQYYIEDMLIKLTKAFAKGFLDADTHTELEELAKQKVDTSYEKTVTVEELKEKIMDLELEVTNLTSGVMDLTNIVFKLRDLLNETNAE